MVKLTAKQLKKIINEEVQNRNEAKLSVSRKGDKERSEDEEESLVELDDEVEEACMEEVAKMNFKRVIKEATGMPMIDIHIRKIAEIVAEDDPEIDPALVVRELTMALDGFINVSKTKG